MEPITKPQFTRLSLEKEIVSALKEFNLSITKIQKDVNYWFLRTYSGKFFDLFIKNNAIALGWDWEKEIDYNGDTSSSMQIEYWNMISRGHYCDIEPHCEDNVQKAASKVSEILRNSKNKDRDKYKEAKDIVRHLSPEAKEYAERALKKQAVAKIFRFERSMKCGDVVMIPNCKTTKLMVGIITSDIVRVNLSNRAFKEKDAPEICFPSSRARTVRWITKVPIESKKLNSKISPLLCSQHAITNATQCYANFINQAVYPLYRDNETYHLNIPVVPPKRIKNKGYTDADYASLFKQILYIRLYFSVKTGIDIISGTVDTKLNVQSPGWIEFSSLKDFIPISIIALFFCVSGGEIKTPVLSVKFNGIMPYIIELFKELRLNAEEKNKMELKLLEHATPEVRIAYITKELGVNNDDLVNSMKLEKHPGITNEIKQ